MEDTAPGDELHLVRRPRLAFQGALMRPFSSTACHSACAADSSHAHTPREAPPDDGPRGGYSIARRGPGASVRCAALQARSRGARHPGGPVPACRQSPPVERRPAAPVRQRSTAPPGGARAPRDIPAGEFALHGGAPGGGRSLRPVRARPLDPGVPDYRRGCIGPPAGARPGRHSLGAGPHAYRSKGAPAGAWWAFTRRERAAAAARSGQPLPVFEGVRAPAAPARRVAAPMGARLRKPGNESPA